MIFIGDSNVARLGDAVKNCILDEATHEFLKDSSFVGVGGTKWWLLNTELHGIFKSAKKRKDYGNQWAKHFNKYNDPTYFDAAIIMVLMIATTTITVFS